MTNKSGFTDVWFVVEPRLLLLDLAGPAEALRSANVHLQDSGHAAKYRLRYVGVDAEMSTSVGLGISALEPLPTSLPTGSVVVLVGRPTSGPQPASHHRSVMSWLRDTVRRELEQGSASLIAVCEGALTAASAGLLDDRQCTTHHELLDRLRVVAPSAKLVSNRVFVIDGPVSTCAGAVAGLDLTLAMIAKDCGEAIAAQVASTLNVYFRRGPDDPELSPLLRYRNHMSAAVHRTQDAINHDPSAAWSAADMALVAAVSPRHLDRLFVEHTGVLPREYHLSVRLDRAELLRARGASVGEAASFSGFSSEQQYRRARISLLNRR
jgi:transcriptional regulator GlxA family with amidase domain